MTKTLTEKSALKRIKAETKRLQANYFQKRALSIIPIAVKASFELENDKNLIDKNYLISQTTFDAVIKMAGSDKLPKQLRLEAQKWLGLNLDLPKSISFTTSDNHLIQSISRQEKAVEQQQYNQQEITKLLNKALG
ncbi:hypothetical protein [Photobacterium leiognathi]|uniref:hypothetical protein n=1 Tax=Photobacterium leiognathi TaxID=553611 RepID=UPI0029815E38|nr:hypothetical protein [Photobacterium leiognathi]